MSSEPPSDPGRFAQALHDEACRNAAYLGHDLCHGHLPIEAPDLAWAHQAYHRLAKERGATCSCTRLILGVGGQSAKLPRAEAKRRARRVVATDPQAGVSGPPPWYLLDAIAHLALASYLTHGRWPGPDSSPAGGSCRTWADVAAHLRAGGITLERLLDGRFPGFRGSR